MENISAIAEVVSDYPEIPLILDPVLASGRGDELANDDMLIAMRELLIPQTTIITPNSIEARRLALDDRDDKDDRSNQPQIRDRTRGIDLPLRVNERELRRPKYFPEIKPNSATGDQQSL